MVIVEAYSILPFMVRTGADIIDMDWMVPLDEARQKAGPDVVLCGNINPSGILLQGTPQQVAEAGPGLFAERRIAVYPDAGV